MSAPDPGAPRLTVLDDLAPVSAQESGGEKAGGIRRGVRSARRPGKSGGDKEQEGQV